MQTVFYIINQYAFLTLLVKKPTAMSGLTYPNVIWRRQWRLRWHFKTLWFRVVSIGCCAARR